MKNFIKIILIILIVFFYSQNTNCTPAWEGPYPNQPNIKVNISTESEFININSEINMHVTINFDEYQKDIKAYPTKIFVKMDNYEFMLKKLSGEDSTLIENLDAGKPDTINLFYKFKPRQFIGCGDYLDFYYTDDLYNNELDTQYKNNNFDSGYGFISLGKLIYFDEDTGMVELDSPIVRWKPGDRSIRSIARENIALKFPSFFLKDNDGTYYELDEYIQFLEGNGAVTIMNPLNYSTLYHQIFYSVVQYYYGGGYKRIFGTKKFYDEKYYNIQGDTFSFLINILEKAYEKEKDNPIYLTNLGVMNLKTNNKVKGGEYIIKAYELFRKYNMNNDCYYIPIIGNYRFYTRKNVEFIYDGMEDDVSDE
jgi:hypothetical protein